MGRYVPESPHDGGTGETRWKSLIGFHLEILFPDTADGAYPIIRDILKSGSGSDSSFWIANCRIINPVAYRASIFLHSQNGL